MQLHQYAAREAEMERAGEEMAWWREPTAGQWCTFAAAWIGWVLDAFDFTIFLLVLPRIAKDLGVGVTAAAGSITLTLLVRLVGGGGAGAGPPRAGAQPPRPGSP